ncbi:MAG: hypothetical protein JWM43_792 [Acidobacteriaceae bacterium]|nr:hypothetical protein [Acidobacteriaceae bacterium]
MQYPVCRHIKTNGTRCKSPAMTDNTWCFFHARIHRRHSSYRFTDKTSGYLRRGVDLQLCVLEDRESVLFSLSLVVNALSTGNLEPDRARTLLYGLQLASQITARPAPSPLPEDIIRSTTLDAEELDLSEVEGPYPPESDTQNLSGGKDLEPSRIEDRSEAESKAESKACDPTEVKVQAAPEALSQSIPQPKQLTSHQHFDLSRVRPTPSEPISDTAAPINEHFADDRKHHCVKFA